MSQIPPLLKLENWLDTRDIIHQYARIIGKIRGFYMPKSKHWWHITLTVNARGLTTTPFPIEGRIIEIELDFVSHKLSLFSDNGWHAGIPFTGNNPSGICSHITQTLRSQNVELDEQLLDCFTDDAALTYDPNAADRFRRTLSWIDLVFRTFKGGLREETSPVQLFPHHLDIAMNWFSGRRIPGVDPDDEENSDEQMNFGFVTGDSSINEAYFYATAYPAPKNWGNLDLPQDAYWHTEGWTGAILPYAVLTEADDPQALLLEFLHNTQHHGSSQMT